MKTNIKQFISIYLLIFIIVSQNEPDEDEKPDQINERITATLDLEDFEDEKIANYQQKSCQGECVDINMQLPDDRFWSTSTPVNGWTTSHGTPSVQPYQIFMWSYRNYGEGVNLGHHFDKDMDYCLQTVLTTQVSGNQIPDPDAVFNIFLTQNRVEAIPLGNYLKPATPAIHQDIFLNNKYISDLPSGTAVHVMDFTATHNFDNVWFHPDAVGRPVVYGTIRRVRICLKKPCEQVKLLLHYYRRRCGLIHFHHHLFNLGGGTIIGYIWDFGDGNYSNDPHPTHDYNATGVWTVKLTVHIMYGKKCCTKVITRRIRTIKCDPCQKLVHLHILANESGGMVTFSPSIAHHPYYLYQWTILGGLAGSTDHTTREVSKSSAYCYYVELIIHSVYNNEQEQECCHKKVYRKYCKKTDQPQVFNDVVANSVSRK